MRLIAQVPYMPRNEPEIKFETYRFYLECIRQYLLQEYNNWKSFGQKCISSTGRVQGISGFDEAWMERFLKISWNTEYLSTLGAKDPELLRINNQWVPIQIYYAVYACAEALAYVLDGEKADGHQKAMRKVTNYFIQSGLSPWDKAYHGPRGKSRQQHRPTNFPKGLRIPHNLQRRDVSPLEMLAKCLKAEHSNRIKELWKKEMSIYQYKYNPGYTGLIHFLYKLRIKSSYKEVDIFVSKAPEENIRSFTESIVLLCFWTLLYMEIIIIRKCKKKFLLELGKKYLQLNPNADQLQDRLQFYKKAV